MPDRRPASSTSRLLAPALALACGATPAWAMDGWAFNPAEDAFSPDAQLDLRSLNEKVAGESGFVARSKDGNDFVLGNGKPARFWCINGGAEKTEDLAHEARFLAKHGVNMIRLHMALNPKTEGSKVTDVDHAVVERIWHTVAAMKKEGIYCTISPYWAMGNLPASWGIKDHASETGVLFCDPTLQAGYKAWMKALYGETNPDTGVPLAKEPAVGIIQLQNEDSLLFWTMMGFIKDRGEPFDILRKGFGGFAAKKYGGIDKALAAWGGSAAPDDDAANGLLGFYQVWEITSNPGGPKGERVADQIEFWCQTMHDFNQNMVTYLRDELGCKQLINAGNWRPADVVKQFDAEHWSYTATDIIAVNRYMGGIHLGENNGWAIEPGSHYTNDTITRNPTMLAINAKQVVGHPYLVTESNWVLPDLYESEGPLAIAAYSSLTGVDGYYWFASGSREWDVAQWPWGKMFKWSVSTAMGVGQFPAGALIYRNSYLKAGETVVHEERELSDIWHERTPLIAEEAGYDPNRDAQLPVKSSVKTTANPMAFLVGRCEVVYGGDPAKSKVADLKKYIDEDTKTITSTTGEEKIDYGNGLFTVNAPKAQGAAGSLGKAGSVTLADVTIACANAYATVTVVAMDDKPIKDSGRLLVQIGTIMRPTGWTDHEDEFEINGDTHEKAKGFTVDSIGNNPWLVENASGTVTIRNAGIVTATIVDPNGMAAGDAQGSSAGGAYTLTLPANALYVVLAGKPSAKPSGKPAEKPGLGGKPEAKPGDPKPKK